MSIHPERIACARWRIVVCFACDSLIRPVAAGRFVHCRGCSPEQRFYCAAKSLCYADCRPYAGLSLVVLISLISKFRYTCVFSMFDNMKGASVRYETEPFPQRKSPLFLNRNKRFETVQRDGLNVLVETPESQAKRAERRDHLNMFFTCVSAVAAVVAAIFAALAYVNP